MREYFDAEMRLLHEGAQEFARAHPEQARMLNLAELRDRDPYIERLLEGMAFLTAHIRSRIDAAETAVSEQLLAHVCPNQLNPYPSTTVVQFSAESYRQAHQVLPAGLELLSEPVGASRVSCRFRTSRELLVQPLTIDEVSVEEQTGANVLRIGFQFEGNGKIDELDLSELPLFLHADYPLAAALYAALVNGVQRVSIKLAGKQEQRLELGGQECFRPLHLEPEDSLLPRSRRGRPGFDLLQDYFCSREKYLFVAFGTGRRIAWPVDCRHFTLEIRCQALLPPEHKLATDNLRLHCVPAVNLYAAHAEPVDVHHRQSEYRLSADSRYPQEVLIYSVDKVAGRDYRSGTVSEFVPVHGLRNRRDDERSYHLTRRDFGAALPHVYISLGGGARLDRESLSCDITVCNGHLPRQHLHENQIRVPGPAVPSGLRFRNITRPTPLWQPPARKEYPWRLNALLSLNLGSLAQTDALKQLLELFEWSGRREQRNRIDAIADVRCQPVHRLLKGMLHRGVEITVTVQESGFPGLGDIYLFGQVLHRFFSLSAAMDEFVQTRVVCLPSNKEYLWQARLGQNSPI